MAFELLAMLKIYFACFITSHVSFSGLWYYTVSKCYMCHNVHTINTWIYTPLTQERTRHQHRSVHVINTGVYTSSIQECTRHQYKSVHVINTGVYTSSIQECTRHQYKSVHVINTRVYTSSMQMKPQGFLMAAFKTWEICWCVFRLRCVLVSLGDVAEPWNENTICYQGSFPVLVS